MKIRIFLILLTVMQITWFANSSLTLPFATQLFTFTFTSPNPTTPQTMTVTSIHGSWAAYSRSLTFYGFQVNLANSLKFKMYLESNATSTVASITVCLDPSTQIIQLMGLLMMVDTSLSMLWMENYTTIFSTVNIATSSQRVENYQVALPGPSGSVSEFSFYSPITWIEATSQSGAEIGMIRNVALSATPDFLDITISCTNQAIYKMGFVVIVYNATSLSVSQLAYINMIIDINTTNTISVSQLNVPNSFRVAGNHFGYYCGTGMYTFTFTGNSAFIVFPNVGSRYIPLNLTATNLQVIETVLCIRGVSCGATTYYSSGTCLPCLTHCSVCTNATICVTCSASYFLNQNSTACPSCTNQMPNCATCSNQTICLTCLAGFILDLSSNCSLCGDAYPNCLNCTSGLCSQCQPSYILDASGTSCIVCNSTINYCTQCTSASNCTQCQSPYTLNPSGTSCLICNATINYCTQCTSASNCTQCQSPYTLDASGTSCIICNATINYCTQCSSASNCTQCQSPYTLDASGTSCIICNATMSNCVQCTSISNCTQCQPLYTLDASGTSCIICNVTIGHCTQCTSASNCTQCQPLYTLDASGTSCIICNTTLNNCVQCTSTTNCTQCQTGYGVQLLNNTCFLCPDLIPFCDTCVSTIYCLACVNTSYTLTSTHLCALCQTLIPKCIACLNSTYCIQCVNTSTQMYVLTANFQCQQCSIALSGCQICRNRTYCQTCSYQKIMNTNNFGCHPCYIGWYVAGMCTSIIGCIQPVLNSDGSGGCLTCSSTIYNPVPVNDVCECSLGWKVNGGCTTVFHCILVVYASDGSSLCKACDVTSGLILFQNTCVCKAHFELKGGDCFDICGDGYLEDNGSDKCDDGNIEDGDGCSSSCQVEVGYRCQNGSSTHSSQCTYVGVPLKISVKSIKRYQSENRGIFSFKVSPPLSIIGKVNLFQNVNLTCQANYQISQISYSSGNLTLTVDYSTDMQGVSCSLSLSFNSSFISKSIKSLYFSAKSSTLALIITKSSSQASIANFMFKFFAYSGLTVFLVSLPHKMIGAQFLTCLQTVYFSILLYSPFKTPFNSIQNLQLITGYYPLFGEKDKQYVFPFSGWMEANHQILTNIGPMLLALMAIALIFTLLAILDPFFSEKESETANFSCQKKLASTKFQKVKKIVYDWLLFPITMGFAPSILISVFIGSFNPADTDKVNSLYDSLGQLLCLVIVGLVFFTELLYCLAQFKQGIIGGLQKAKSIYVPLFIIRSLLLSLLFQLQIILSLQEIYYCILFLESLFSIFVIFYRPYTQVIDNIGIISCELSSLFAVLVPFLIGKIEMGEQMLVIMMLIMEGFLSISLILCLVRMIIVYKQLVAKLCKGQIKSDKQQLVGKQSNLSLKVSVQNNEIDRSLRQKFMKTTNHLALNFNNQVIPIDSKIREQLKRKNIKTPRYMQFQSSAKAIKEERSSIVQDQELQIIKNKLRQNLKTKKQKYRK